jgi:Thioredoxin domain-containing protein
MKIIFCIFATLFAYASIVYGAATQEVPVKDMVTVVDLGAKTCIPCKMMVPVLDAMEKHYHGKAAIVFIDVREAPDQASKFGIRAIPTQVFFDKTGKEVYRHEGFLDEKPFSEMLEKILAN